MAEGDRPDPLVASAGRMKILSDILRSRVLPAIIAASASRSSLPVC